MATFENTMRFYADETPKYGLTNEQVNEILDAHAEILLEAFGFAVMEIGPAATIAALVALYGRETVERVNDAAQAANDLMNA